LAQAPIPKKRWQRIVGRVGALVSLGIALSGISYFTLRPKLTVVPGEFIDSKMPLTARFEVRNDGEIPVYDVFPSSIWVPILRPAPFKVDASFTRVFFRDTNFIKRLEPGTGFVCHFDEFAATPLIPTGNYLIQIVVVYKVPLWPKQITNTFKFAASANAAGDYHMTAEGSGQSVEDFTKDPTSQ
jgi:hypothetical protein